MLLLSLLGHCFQPVTAMEWIRATEVTPVSDTYFNVTGLHEGIDYAFRVAAENRAGLGSYSDKTYVHKGQSLISVILGVSTSQAIVWKLYHAFCILSKPFLLSRLVVCSTFSSESLRSLSVTSHRLPFYYLECHSVRRTLLYTGSSFRAQIVYTARAELTFGVDNALRAVWAYCNWHVVSIVQAIDLCTL